MRHSVCFRGVRARGLVERPGHHGEGWDGGDDPRQCPRGPPPSLHSPGYQGAFCPRRPCLTPAFPISPFSPFSGEPVPTVTGILALPVGITRSLPPSLKAPTCPVSTARAFSPTARSDQDRQPQARRLGSGLLSMAGGGGLQGGSSDLPSLPSLPSSTTEPHPSDPVPTSTGFLMPTPGPHPRPCQQRCGHRDPHQNESPAPWRSSHHCAWPTHPRQRSTGQENPLCAQ